MVHNAVTHIHTFHTYVKIQEFIVRIMTGRERRIKKFCNLFQSRNQGTSEGNPREEERAKQEQDLLSFLDQENELEHDFGASYHKGLK